MYKTEPLSASNFHLAAPLLAAYKHKPYQAYTREFGPAAINNFFVTSVQEGLGSPNTRSVCLSQDGKIVGLGIWSFSSLESEVFGFRAARLDYLIAEGDYDSQCKVKRRLLTELLDQCTSAQVQHLSVRINAADWSSIHSLEEHGFVLIDGLITYGQNLSNRSWSPQESSTFQIRPLSSVDLPQAKELARSAFTFDRLHTDPAVPKLAADESHAIWLENSYRTADRVLVAADEFGILGYSVYKVNDASVPHFGEPIGVWVIAATVERARGRGVAKSLCLSMLVWYRDQGIRIVEGGTQLANVASARLHESCGFRVASTSLSLSKWIGAAQ